MRDQENRREVRTYERNRPVTSRLDDADPVHFTRERRGIDTSDCERSSGSSRRRSGGENVCPASKERTISLLLIVLSSEKRRKDSLELETKYFFGEFAILRESLDERSSSRTSNRREPESSVE